MLIKNNDAKLTIRLKHCLPEYLPDDITIRTVLFTADSVVIGFVVHHSKDLDFMWYVSDYTDDLISAKKDFEEENVTYELVLPNGKIVGMPL